MPDGKHYKDHLRGIDRSWLLPALNGQGGASKKRVLSSQYLPEPVAN